MAAVQKVRPQKVMVFGTFDGLHQGHLNLFTQARKYGNYLIVVVARDVNVLKIKGHEPRKSERQRLKDVSDVELVSLAVLGNIKDPYAVIRRYRPSIIALGYDQNSFTENLKEDFLILKFIV
jgi:FAD synthetase